MSGEHRLEALDDRTTLLWGAAVLLYGVGDTVATLWGLSVSNVAEAGPVAGPVMAAHGEVALLAVKAVVIGGFYLVWRLVRTPSRVALPLALSVVGAAVTTWNLVVIALSW